VGSSDREQDFARPLTWWGARLYFFFPSLVAASALTSPAPVNRFAANLPDAPSSNVTMSPTPTDGASNDRWRSLRTLRAWEWAGCALVVGAAARTAWLTVSYLLARRGAMRFQVESAATAFVVLAFVFAWLRREQRRPVDRARDAGPILTVIVWFLLALALYGRMLFTGFLSDDYVLVERAWRWHIGAVSTELFRPLPLTLWAVLLHTGAGAVSLHVVNISLHGVNAFLVTRLVGRWLAGRAPALLAGALFLTSPLGPEAVVWCSGVFDVLATSLVLACVLVSRGYDASANVARRSAFIALGLCALFSKETAAVAGVLVLVDAWLRRSRARALVVDAAVLMGIAAVFGVTRIAASNLVRQPLTRYTVQRFLFGEFGSLAVPWHVRVIQSTPLLPIVTVCIVIGLSVTFALTRGGRERTRVVVAAIAWIVAGGAPVATLFFVAPDLQGSRYLYLPAVGWVALLVALAGEPTGDHDGLFISRAASIALAALIVAGAGGVWFHQEPWRRAAALRNQVEAAARADTRLAACPAVRLRDLPDSVDGAYVFRNGAIEAFARDVHVTATLDEVPEECALRWSAAAGAFLTASQEP
jgi:hypothetical protein